MRGNEIAMIFQDPLTSLHPFHKVGKQLLEAILTHQDVSKQAPGGGRSSCWGWWGSPIRSAAWTSTRTSSPAGCASGR